MTAPSGRAPDEAPAARVPLVEPPAARAPLEGASDESPTMPEDIAWRDPDDIEASAAPRGLSEIGDRRLRDLRANEPKLKGAGLKLGLMVALLVGILIFHSEFSSRAAGCYETASGLDEKVQTRETPSPPTRTNQEVQVQIRRLPAEPSPPTAPTP